MITIVLTAAMLLACVPASAGAIVHDDGGVYDYLPHTVSVHNWIVVKDTTTVNVLTGSQNPNLFRVHAYGTSTVNVSGGTVHYATAYGNSTLNVSEGSVSHHLHAYDTGTVNVSGGTIGFGGRNGLVSFDTSSVNVTGGEIWGPLNAAGSSTVYVSGYASVWGWFMTQDYGTITIYGTFDNFDYGVYADGGLLDGETLTGTLADDHDFVTDVDIRMNGTVILATLATAVPEPSSLAMFGIGALGLFGYGRRRRQTSAAA